jgi:hypothetical protein
MFSAAFNRPGNVQKVFEMLRGIGALSWLPKLCMGRMINEESLDTSLERRRRSGFGRVWLAVGFDYSPLYYVNWRDRESRVGHILERGSKHIDPPELNLGS